MQQRKNNREREKSRTRSKVRGIKKHLLPEHRGILELREGRHCAPASKDEPPTLPSLPLAAVALRGIGASSSGTSVEGNPNRRIRRRDPSLPPQITTSLFDPNSPREREGASAERDRDPETTNINITGVRSRSDDPQDPEEVDIIAPQNT